MESVPRPVEDGEEVEREEAEGDVEDDAAGRKGESVFGEGRRETKKLEEIECEGENEGGE